MSDKQAKDTTARANEHDAEEGDVPDGGRRKALGKLAYAAPVIATLAASGRASAQGDTGPGLPPAPPPIGES